MALRLSGSIMELAKDFQKGRSPAHHAGGQQVALGQKRAALQPWILALANDPEHTLMGQFQILQEDAFKLAAPVRILRRGPKLLQGKAKVAFEHLPTEELRPVEEAVRKAFNLTHAEFFAPEGSDEQVNVRRRV